MSKPIQRSLFNSIFSGLILIVLFLFSLLLILSLFSYYPEDDGWARMTQSSESYRNLLGQYGAYYADLLLSFFGIVAYIFPFLLLYLSIKGCIALYKQKYVSRDYFLPSFLILGLFGFLIFCCGLFSLMFADNEHFTSGGILGILVLQAILPSFGYLFSVIFLIFMTFVFITLILHFSWLNFFEFIGSMIFKVAFLLAALFTPKWYKSWKALNDNSLNASNLKSTNINVKSDAESEMIKTDSLSEIDVEAPLLMDRESQQQANEITSQNKIERFMPPKNSFLKRDLETAENKTKNKLTRAQLLQLQNLVTELTAKKQLHQQLEQETASSDSSLLKNIEIIAIDEKPFALESIEFDEGAESQSEAVQEFVEDESFKESFKESNEVINNPQFSATNMIEEEIDEELAFFDLPQQAIAENSFLALKQEESELNQINDINIIDINVEELAPTVLPFSHEVKPEITNVNESEIQEIEVLKRQESTLEMPLSEISAVKNEHYFDSRDLKDKRQQMIDELIAAKDESIIHPSIRKTKAPASQRTTALPSLSLLNKPDEEHFLVDNDLLEEQATLLEKCLLDFRVKCKVVGYEVGPVITRFEVELAPGVKASRISGLDRDIARSLSLSSVRVVEVIPGKPYVGIELPNPKRQIVYFKDVLESEAFKNSKSKLTVALGQDISGNSIVADLAKMPHLLVAGTTGSGKSVGVNAMILSILFKAQPDEVRFIMIDPKVLELSVYNGIPHLLTEVITDMKDVVNALNWCVEEMENRYQLMSSLGVRNIVGYNERIEIANEAGMPIPNPNWTPTSDMSQTIPELEKLPYIVVVVDEFADLMMTVGKAAEALIIRLAQKARAAGIHIILATQRPSVDVITGVIKANIPTRIGFTVSSKIDSRTILDQMGAETLLGMGDMLYLAPNSSIPTRVHGAFIDDKEVECVVADWKACNIATNYIDKITQPPNKTNENSFKEDLDPIYEQVLEKTIELQKMNTSLMSRFFNVGYNRAARIIDQLEANGVLSAPAKNGSRTLLISSLERRSNDDF